VASSSELVDSTTFETMCSIAVNLHPSAQDRLNRIADAPVAVYERAWGVASTRDYLEVVNHWRVRVGWRSPATDAVLLGLLVRSEISEEDFGELCNAWKMVTKHDVASMPESADPSVTP
jgi:hypothetical protein